jgi:hypothetical protein
LASNDALLIGGVALAGFALWQWAKGETGNGNGDGNGDDPPPASEYRVGARVRWITTAGNFSGTIIAGPVDSTVTQRKSRWVVAIDNDQSHFVEETDMTVTGHLPDGTNPFFLGARVIWVRRFNVDISGTIIGGPFGSDLGSWDVQKDDAFGIPNPLGSVERIHTTDLKFEGTGLSNRMSTRRQMGNHWKLLTNNRVQVAGRITSMGIHGDNPVGTNAKHIIRHAGDRLTVTVGYANNTVKDGQGVNWPMQVRVELVGNDGSPAAQALNPPASYSEAGPWEHSIGVQLVLSSAIEGRSFGVRASILAAPADGNGNPVVPSNPLVVAVGWADQILTVETGILGGFVAGNNPGRINMAGTRNPGILAAQGMGNSGRASRVNPVYLTNNLINQRGNIPAVSLTNTSGTR